MNKQNVIGKRNYILKTIFVFSILVNLIRIDNLVYSSIDFQKHQTLFTTELVIQKLKTDATAFYRSFSSSFGPVGFYDTHSESIHFNRYALFYYNDFQLIHFKVLNDNSISQIHFFNIIHKNNISHLSLDEDSLLLS